MAKSRPGPGFVPPPYPQDRLAELRGIADAAPGGIVDGSVGTPVDPTPEVALRAAGEAARSSAGYPPSIGTLSLRTAAAAWIDRRFHVKVGADAITACVGTKEVVASLPRMLSLRDPSRDVVLYPEVSYPTYAMGAVLAGLRPVPVPVDRTWHLDLDAVDAKDAARALVVWFNDPSNPTGVGATAAAMAAAVSWARGHGAIVASDECYAEFTADDAGNPVGPVTALAGSHDSVLALHSLSKRSNMAGFRVGFVAGDPDLVRYLGEVRKHAGLIVPSPAQAAGAAALGDDAHVDEQRARYARRRARSMPALEAFGLVHDGGPSSFYLWLRDGAGAEDGWAIAARLAATGLLVAPGDLYGPAGARHVRLALSIPDDRLGLALERLVGAR
ncbi:MAG: aminotransferase class I/II-fold pyridoxal phosphate-dependent enzyme [Acidimicrobiia bacterium]|nr:aminotransferase class I/II-fold pyridoxal phosphate-dependent enzyme [Acidimicrobiia bacterium]